MPRKTKDRPGPPEVIPAGFGPRVVALAGRVRTLILGMIDGVTETVDRDRGAIGFHRREQFATLELHEDHVRLVLEQGAVLPDFGGLLEGDGDRARHIEIRTARAAGSVALKTLLSAALFDDDTHGFRKRAPKPGSGKRRR
jgi:hypothetical protein